MMADLRRARAQNPKLIIGVVQDGAPEMWNRMRDSLRAELNVAGWGIECHHGRAWRTHSATLMG
jgi:hypothetical protein